MTALINATYRGYEDVVNVLVGAGADLNIQNSVMH